MTAEGPDALSCGEQELGASSRVGEDSHYRSIFENAVEGIYQTTVDGQYIRVNPALARMYGFDGPNHLIASFTDIAGQLYVDPNRRHDFATIMARDGVVTDFQAQVYRRDH